MHFDKSWDKCLSLAEFSYNNSYQASLKMAPFDALYGWRCLTPLNWSEAGERTLWSGLSQSCRRGKRAIMIEEQHTDNRQFEVGNFVYLKVSPTKGVQRLGVKGKLDPRYIGPYESLKYVGQWHITSDFRSGSPQSTMCFM
jgi:hypothetical protein